MSQDARATLGELAAKIEEHLGRRLLGLYLFGSLAVGGFDEGRSDLDLIAVLESDVAEGADLDELRTLHEEFEAARPTWRDRIEVLYVSRTVLASFALAPTGTVARISPGEPLHHRELGGDMGWLLDWHAVVTAGETLFGSRPQTFGPAVSRERFRTAVLSQLRELRAIARQHDVAYVPVQQGYIVATVARALYALATGRQSSKQEAVAWAAQQFPERAAFLIERYRAYRADIRGPHQHLIDFVDEAADRAGQPPMP